MPSFHEKLKDSIPHVAPASSISMFGTITRPQHEFTIDTYSELHGKDAYNACVSAKLFTQDIISSMQDSYKDFFMKAPNSTTPKDTTNEYYARQCFLRGFHYALENDVLAHEVFTNVINQLSEIDTARLLAGNAAKVSVKPERVRVLLTSNDHCILRNILLNNTDTKAQLLEAFIQASTHRNPNLPSLTDYAVNIIEAAKSLTPKLFNAGSLTALSQLISPNPLMLRHANDTSARSGIALTVFSDGEENHYGKALHNNLHRLSRKLTQPTQNSDSNQEAMGNLIRAITSAEQQLISELFPPKGSLEENEALLKDIDRSIKYMSQQPENTTPRKMGVYHSQMQTRIASIVETLQSQITNINDRQDTLRLEAALKLLNEITPGNRDVAEIQNSLAMAISRLGGTNSTSRSSTPDSGIDMSGSRSPSPKLF